MQKEQTKAIKDKNGTILKIGDKVQEIKGKLWKLENFNGVAMLVYPTVGKWEATKVLSKVDFSKFEKVD